MAVFFLRMGVAVLGFFALLPASYATRIQKLEVPSGVEAWLVEDYTVPMIALNFAFSGGAAQDPDGKPGVASMLSGLLDEGAGDMDSKAFQAELADRSIRLGFEAGRDSFFGSLVTLSENRDEAFDLLALALQKPRLDAEPVGRIRAQIDSRIKSSSTDPDTLAMLAMCEAAFPGHPYGRPVDGTVESVAAITVDDLAAYRSRIFARDNVKIAIVGAIDAAGATAMIDRAFGPLPAQASLIPVPDIVPAASTIAVELDNPQTVIRFGGPGIPRHDPDFITAYVVNHILGGGSFSSRLYSEVREKRGLAYSVSTTLVPLEHSSAVAGGTATRADRAEETVDLIKSEIASFAETGPTADELDKAKRSMIGSYPLRFDSSGKISRQLLGIMIDDLGIDYIDRRNGLIDQVTLEDAKRVAKRLLANGTEMVVTVGPKTPVVASQPGPPKI